MTRARDDFSRTTKDLIARRVGYRCSNPDCQRPTMGPQANPLKTINIGVAAHLTAASGGGSRFDASLTGEQRRSPDNGIWLCETCAKLIDTDVTLFPIEILRLWRLSAEQRALVDLLHPPGLAVIEAEGLNLQTIRRQRDLGVLRLIFDHLHLPSFDEFFETARNGSFADQVLFFEELFTTIVDAPSFHTNDSLLEEKARLLSAALNDAFSYGNRFNLAETGWAYHFEHYSSDWEEVFAQFLIHIDRLQHAFTEFVRYVKTEFPELDLAVTDARAITEYSESMAKIQERPRKRTHRGCRGRRGA